MGNDIYTESKRVKHLTVRGWVTVFEQGWRTRHAVTVISFDDAAENETVFVDSMMAFPSSNAEAIRHCIGAIDACAAQIERVYTPALDSQDNELPF